MAKSKSPRKKHNHNARMIKAGDKICENSFILAIIGLGKDGAEWVKNGVVQTKNTARVRDFELMYCKPRPWSFVFGTVCRDQLGRGYIKYEHQALSNQHAFDSDEIQKYVGEQLNLACDDVNPDHLLTPFCIASPEKYEFSDEEVKKIMEWKGVERKLKTRLEMDVLRDKGMAELRTIDPTRYTDKRIWTILRQNGVKDFADMRAVGLKEIKAFKGIGPERVKQLANGYHALLNDETLVNKIATLRDFEERTSNHYEALQFTGAIR